MHLQNEISLPFRFVHQLREKIICETHNRKTYWTEAYNGKHCQSWSRKSYSIWNALFTADISASPWKHAMKQTRSS